MADMKALASQNLEDHRKIEYLARHGIAYARQLARIWNIVLDEIEPDVISAAIQLIMHLQRILDSKNQSQSAPIHESDPIPNQTILSRIIGFGADCARFV
jgi:hypothetical protein